MGESHRVDTEKRSKVSDLVDERIEIVQPSMCLQVQKMEENRKAVDDREPEDDRNSKLLKIKTEFLQEYRKSFYQVAMFQLIIIYLEVVFHLLTFKTLGIQIMFPVFLGLIAGALLTFVTTLFEKKVNVILTWIFTSFLCLIFCVQLVYHDIFKAFLSLYSIGTVGGDVLEFKNQIISAIGDNLFGIMMLILPLPVMLYLIKNRIDLGRKHLGWQVTLIVSSVLMQILFVMILPAYGKEVYSPYDLYHNTWIQEMGVQQFGLLTSTRFDLKNLVLTTDSNSLESGLVIQTAFAKTNELPVTTYELVGSDSSVIMKELVGSTSPSVTDIPKPTDTPTPTDSPTPTVTATPIPINTSPNVLDINFGKLAELETNETIKTMHQYFMASTPTKKNEYTGMFEGYNLIMLTAEGFSPYAVDKQITPTLYKLIHEGFIFNDFYTPLWWASTIDGEYVACTSLIPKAGVTSFFLSGSNSMPFTLGTQFGKLGYCTQAYHNHTYTYYKRHISHPNMGYEYKGVGNGLEITKSWPESDLEMIEVTIPQYIDKQPFHTYYMTVSGHMNYTFMGNSMATKNKAAVDDLPYSMEAKAYIACNVELDRALEKLISELEQKGIADKTVIALSADHYPYGLEKDKIDELAGHVVEENFELYRNHFILWSASMKEPVIIDKPCSSLDILPTLSNLFALPYDSRLFLGQDILSDSAPFVIFSNRSFINDKVIYNSVTKDVINLTGEELAEDYIRSMNQIVNNKFLISESILEEDYYSYILPK